MDSKKACHAVPSQTQRRRRRVQTGPEKLPHHSAAKHELTARFVRLKPFRTLVLVRTEVAGQLDQLRFVARYGRRPNLDFARPSEAATRRARTELSHSRRGTGMSVPGLGMKVRVLLCALEYGSQRPSQRGQEAGREQLEVRSRHPVEGDAAAHEMT